MHKREAYCFRSQTVLLAATIIILAYLFSSWPLHLGSPSGAAAARLSTVTVVASDPLAAEMGTNGTVSSNIGVYTINRVGPTTIPLTVFYSLTGSATNDGGPTHVRDYVTLVNTTTFPAGVSAVNITLRPIEDTISSTDLFVEATEQAILQLLPKPLYSVGSLNSATVSIMEDDPLPSPGLNPPTNLKKVAATHAIINLAWTDNSNEKTFRIYRAWAGNNYVYGQLNFVGENVTNWTDPGVSQNLLYFYRIAAQDASGKKTYSNDIVVLTPPMPPLNLQATALSSSRVNVSWLDLAMNEDGFRIERGTNNVNFTAVGMTGPNAQSFLDTTVTSQTTYYYRGITVKGQLESVPSNTAMVNVP